MARSREKRKGRRRERHHAGPDASTRTGTGRHQADERGVDDEHGAAARSTRDGSPAEVSNSDEDGSRADTSPIVSDNDDKSPAEASASGETAATRSRPAEKPAVASERVRRRTLRLSPRTNAMAERLAAARGIDVNATIAVAIAEDYFRLFGTSVE